MARFAADAGHFKETQMESLKQVLMRRDGLTAPEADEAIEEAAELACGLLWMVEDRREKVRAANAEKRRINRADRLGYLDWREWRKLPPEQVETIHGWLADAGVKA